MNCLTGFMRRECERRRLSEIEIADRINDLGAMADAVAPELLYQSIVLVFRIER